MPLFLLHYDMNLAHARQEEGIVGIAHCTAPSHSITQDFFVNVFLCTYLFHMSISKTCFLFHIVTCRFVSRAYRDYKMHRAAQWIYIHIIYVFILCYMVKLPDLKIFSHLQQCKKHVAKKIFYFFWKKGSEDTKLKIGPVPNPAFAFTFSFLVGFSGEEKMEGKEIFSLHEKKCGLLQKFSTTTEKRKAWSRVNIYKVYRTV